MAGRRTRRSFPDSGDAQTRPVAVPWETKAQRCPPDWIKSFLLLFASKRLFVS